MVTIWLVLLVALAAQAANQREELDILELPPEPETEPREDDGEVQVTIIRRKDAVIEEYRVNGTVRAIKVTPTYGEPYYLVDTDGDGSLERSSSLSDGLLIPTWIIHSWD
jgi:biopolymer transport protein ExbD